MRSLRLSCLKCKGTFFKNKSIFKHFFNFYAKTRDNTPLSRNVVHRMSFHEIIYCGFSNFSAPSILLSIISSCFLIDSVWIN